jgi:hypothetical protein
MKSYDRKWSSPQMTYHLYYDSPYLIIGALARSFDECQGWQQYR